MHAISVNGRPYSPQITEFRKKPTEPAVEKNPVLGYVKDHRWVDWLPVAGFASAFAYRELGEPLSRERVVYGLNFQYQTACCVCMVFILV